MSQDSADPRVYLAADKEDVITFLHDQGPFGTRAAVIAFAAAYGYREGRREPFERSGKDIRWGIFQEEGKSFIADLIAAAEVSDLKIMRDEQGPERRQIFAEYANGGLALLRDRVKDNPLPPLDVILDMVLAIEEPRNTTTTEGLGRLVAEMEREKGSRPVSGD
jgi:dnd system-associated protein 4